MASGWNGSGTVILTDGTYTETWAANWAGDGDPKIKTADHDALLQCVEDSIQNCLPHDGQKAATADIPMGSNNITGLGTPSNNTDAALHGDVIASGAYSSPNIVLTQNDATTISIDVSGLEAGTGGVALTGDQEITGNKEFASLRLAGQTKTAVATPTPGSSVTIDTTANDVHYVTVGTNTDVTFTWPADAADAQLGANWCKRGHILFRHTGAGYTITLNATMLAALDYYEEEGAEATASGDLNTLVYNYYRIGSTKLAQFAWVSTP